jgi:hypothetical protein
MPITVKSPYSGRPVKVRDQDIERAVRDEEGRVFYVVPRPDAEGYYAAPTRKGSPKDLERYDKMQLRAAQVQEQVDEQHRAVHDATGKRRARPLARLITLLVLLAALAGGGYAAYQWWEAQAPAIPEDVDSPLDSPLPDELPTIPKPDL